jgi:hypothetical protein
MKSHLFRASHRFTVLRSSFLTILTLLSCLMFLQPAASGQFLPAVNYPVGYSPFAVVLGDFNGDGILDMAVANTSDPSISILLGTGGGAFAAAGQYSTGGNDTYGLVVGDFNGDGKLDLAALNQSGELSILLGNGDGTFRAGATYTTFSGCESLATGDFNHDGKLDLVTSCGGRIFLGNGDGTFNALGLLPFASAYGGIAVADLNHDGNLDLALVNYFGDTVDIYLGNGDGTFQPPIDYPAGFGPESVTAADFNGDGNLDLVVANSASADSGAKGTVVSVLLGNGDGTFQPSVEYTAGPEPFSVAIGDMDNDGKLDLVVATTGIGESNEINILRGNGDGTFQAPVGYIVDRGPLSVALADLNHDGFLDIVVANFGSNDVSVLLTPYRSLDLNGDGVVNCLDLDIVKASFGRRAGQPGFDPRADVNGDGVVNVLDLSAVSKLVAAGTSCPQ